MEQAVYATLLFHWVIFLLHTTSALRFKQHFTQALAAYPFWNSVLELLTVKRSLSLEPCNTMSDQARNFNSTSKKKIQIAKYCYCFLATHMCLMIKYVLAHKIKLSCLEFCHHLCKKKIWSCIIWSKRFWRKCQNRHTCMEIMIFWLLSLLAM